MESLQDNLRQIIVSFEQQEGLKTYRPIIPIVPTHGEGEGGINETLCKLNVTTWYRKVCNLETQLSEKKETNDISN